MSKSHVEEESVQLIARLRAIRDSIDREISNIRATLWVPREYSIEKLMEPGKYAVVEFGVEFDEPGTARLGLLETARVSFGFERIFYIESLSVRDEDSGHFSIEDFSVGAMQLFRTDVKRSVPAAKFSESASSVVPLDFYADVGVTARVGIRNTSDQPRLFRAVLRGREQPAV